MQNVFCCTKLLNLNAIKWHCDVNEIRVVILGNLVILFSFGLPAFYCIFKIIG
jgi:hypothetical protein